MGLAVPPHLLGTHRGFCLDVCPHLWFSCTGFPLETVPADSRCGDRHAASQAPVESGHCWHPPRCAPALPTGLPHLSRPSAVPQWPCRVCSRLVGRTLVYITHHLPLLDAHPDGGNTLVVLQFHTLMLSFFHFI